MIAGLCTTEGKTGEKVGVAERQDRERCRSHPPSLAASLDASLIASLLPYMRFRFALVLTAPRPSMLPT